MNLKEKMENIDSIKVKIKNSTCKIHRANHVKFRPDRWFEQSSLQKSMEACAMDYWRNDNPTENIEILVDSPVEIVEILS